MYDPARDAFMAADQGEPASSDLEAAEHSSTEPQPVERSQKKPQAKEDTVGLGKKAVPTKVCRSQANAISLHKAHLLPFD